MSLPITLLDRLLDPLADGLTPGVARKILDLHPDQEIQDRIELLRDKAGEGELTDTERAEYEDFIEGMDLMGILKSKARTALARTSA